MATPLASLFLILASAPAWAAPCPVRALDANDNPAALEDSHPTCVAALGQKRRFERLRDAAAIPPAELEYVVEVGVPEGGDNAAYWGRKVGFNDAYLRLYPPAALAPLATLAHEVGHAVQDRQNILHPDQAGWTPQRKLAFSRQIEAQADAIGIELLLRAGYPPEAFVLGREQRFTCGVIREDDPADPGATHPANRHRYINSRVATPVVTAELAARHRANLELLGKASAAELDAAFSGTTRRLGDNIPALTLPGPRAYTPTFALSDFDERGRVLPGRLASSDLRLTPPPANAGPVRREANFILSAYTDRLADSARDVVNWWYTRDSLGDLTVRACGAATGTDLRSAVDYGISDWARDAAVRSAAWLNSLLPGSAPKK